jgi:hypothetical protein
MIFTSGTQHTTQQHSPSPQRSKLRYPLTTMRVTHKRPATDVMMMMMMMMMMVVMMMMMMMMVVMMMMMMMMMMTMMQPAAAPINQVAAPRCCNNHASRCHYSVDASAPFTTQHHARPE